MDQTSDANALAKRFLDLWQEQASLIATDPKLVEMAGLWMHMWQRHATSVTPNAAKPQPGKPDESTAAAATPAGGPPADSAGPAPAAAASGNSQPDPAELARRLAECEARLAALEAGDPAPGDTGRRKRAAPKPRKPAA